MKPSFFSSLLITGLLSTGVFAQSANVEALMSPHQGKEAFTKMYDMIRNAKKDVNIAVYSWSDSGFTKALHAVLDKENAPIVRVALRKDVIKKKMKEIAELEKKGAMFKRAKKELHEKFVLADDIKLVNSSANMSGGARTRYSENFVFFDGNGVDNDSDVASVLKDFKQEFAVIWNSGYDIVTEEELQKADVLDHKLKETNVMTEGKNIALVSSSMNYTLTKPNKRDLENGAVISLKRFPSKKEQTWKVKDQLIKAIREAKKNIYVNINHFNLRDISDELIEAVKRGIDVKFVADSQEFRMWLNNKEMVPQFVQDYRKLKGQDVEVPVRVHFYSLQPHHKYWYLDHHKYILVDYDTEDATDTVLITGSYNFSKTAEHSKFDNQVIFKTAEYKNLYDAFKAEFDQMWSNNRDENDVPDMKIVASHYTAKNNILYLHSNKTIGLKWEEAEKVHHTLRRIHPESSMFPRNKHCYKYNLKTNQFLDKKGEICEKK
jgi:phosphatidylserine/phosphatidylglycerophosphate/cardiolipin synthase-like enzyme